MFRVITIDQLLKELDKYNHVELHVHHTWKPNHSNFDGKNHQKIQQGMKDSHMNTRGWDDIAQHVTLTPDGLFVCGRAFNSQPASIKGYNGSGNKIPFMIEMVGDFDIGRDKLQGKQLESILRLASYFDKKGRYIRFHRENSSKSCPGSSLYKIVNGKVDKSWFMGLVRNIDKPKEVEEDVNKPINIVIPTIEGTKKIEGIVTADGKSFFPVRILEQMGYKVDWQETGQVDTVTVTKKG